MIKIDSKTAMSVDNHVTEDMVKKETARKKRPSKFIAWFRFNWRAILAEFTATGLLMLIGCMTCIRIDGFPLNPPSYAPIGFGLVVLFNIQTFGHISGAHMNPCVTLAAVVWGKLTASVGISYAVAQCVGAVVGYGILVALSPSDFIGSGVCMTLPHTRYSSLQALGFEIVLTGAIVIITCSVWDPQNEVKNESNPLKFGLTVAGLSLAGGPLTGASMNPARSFAPALWNNMWRSHWVYWVGPITGGLLAVFFYKNVLLHMENEKPQVQTWSEDVEERV